MLKVFQDAWMISSVSEMYATAVICLVLAGDSFSVAGRFWLPWYVSKKWWTLAILCNFLFSASHFSSMSFSAAAISNTGSSPANDLVSAGEYCHETRFLGRISPVVFDWVHSIMFCRRERLASTPTPCGIINNMLCATLERSAYVECVSAYSCNQSVISGSENVLGVSMGSKW